MKLKNALILLTTAMILIVLACNTPPAEPTIDHAKVKEDISAIATTWENAINSKDMEAQLALFAENMTSYGPNDAPTVGKAAIKAEMEKNMAADTSGVANTIKFSTNEVFAGGDYVTEIGSWVYSSEDGAVVDKGNYFTLYEKKDDKYMVIRDIWNSEMPKKKSEPMADAEEPDTEE